MMKHYEHWGWQAFLGNIAETKVFDILGSGVDSFECVERANLYKVLMYASEKRDYAIAYQNSIKK